MESSPYPGFRRDRLALAPSKGTWLCVPVVLRRRSSGSARYALTRWRGAGSKLDLPPPDDPRQLAPPARLEQLGEGACRRHRPGRAEGGEVECDQHRLVQLDGCLLVAEAGEPADGGAAVALRLAVTHEQAEGERVCERRPRQAGRGRSGGGDASPLERAAKDRVGMTFARHEHMFAREGAGWTTPPRPCRAWPSGRRRLRLVHWRRGRLRGSPAAFRRTSTTSTRARKRPTPRSPRFSNDEPELEGTLWVESVEFELSTN